MVGADHRSCPASVRDRLASEPFEDPLVLVRLKAAGLDEVLWLSTCDRAEVLTAVAAGEEDAAAEAITRLLAARAGLAPAELTPYLRRRCGEEAIRHLLAVASSLKSQVIGEPEIAGQVKEALATARAAGTIGPTLDAVAQAALQTAKKVRSDTRIGERPTSIAAAAVQTARTVHGTLASCRGLLIGTGDMGVALIEQLMAAGLGAVTVTAPSAARAEALAHRLGGHFALFEELESVLSGADVVVAAVGSGRYVVQPDRITAVLRRRRQRPMLLLDAAIPTDIDPAIANEAAAFVYALDDLERLALAGRAGREAETATAWRLVEAATARLIRDRAERQATPLVTALRRHFETTRLAVLQERPGLDAAAASRLLVNRLLHQPSAALRDLAAETTPGDRATTELAIRRLFGLREDEGGDEDGDT